MFNSGNDISDPVDLVMSVGFMPSPCLSDFNKFENKFGCIFLCPQMRYQGNKKGFCGFFGTTPLPHQVWGLFGSGDSAVYSLVDVLNRICKCIASSYVSRKDVWRSRLFIQSDASIPLNKSSKPFIKGFVWDYCARVAEKVLVNLDGFFEAGNSMNGIGSNFSSDYSSRVPVVKNQLKLHSFYKATGGHLIAKFIRVFRIQIPTINDLFLPVRLFVNNASEFLFEKIWDIFPSVVQANLNRSPWSKRNTTFRVKHSGIIFHIVTLYRKISSLATTKFEGARINSSLCHSLNS